MLKIEILFYFGAIGISTNQQNQQNQQISKSANQQISKTIMKGAYTIISIMASGIWEDLDDASCAMALPTFKCATNKQQRFNKKQKNKKRGTQSEKALARRNEKKTREKAIAGNRDRRESNMHPYEQSSLTYVKSKGRLEDKFSDKNIILHQGKEWLAPYGPNKEGVIDRNSPFYEYELWYKAYMLSKRKKSVSWADEKNKKLVKVKRIAPEKPYNCHLATTTCFMRTYCFCESK
jgi:hypothetical protein